MTATDDCQIRLRLGTVVYVPATRQVVDLDGNPVEVRDKSLRVLAKLARHNGETVLRDDLIEAGWDGRIVSDDNLVQCIKDLRAVLGDSDRRILRTAIGRGYSLHGLRDMRVSPGVHPKLLIAPLRVSGAAPELDELAERVTEELILALTPRAGLKVTSDVGQRDAAQYVVDGRASLAAGILRVFVQLVVRPSGDVAFADTWVAPSDQAGALPRQIADKLGSVLRVHMFNHAGEGHVDRVNDDLTTQDLLSKAAYHMSRIQMQNRDIARDALSLAIEREPGNAMALAMRASTSVILILQEGYAGLPDPPEYSLALADRAVGLAPHVDFVNRTRGNLRLWLRGDHEGARADCARALAVSPVFHLAHQTLAASELLTGEHAAAIRRVERIIKLSPANNPRYPHYLALLALGQTLAGNTGAAATLAGEACDRAPGDPWCAYVRAAALADHDTGAGAPEFRRMLPGLELPLTHFRDMPFTDTGAVDMLEDRLIRAGYPRGG